MMSRLSSRVSRFLLPMCAMMLSLHASATPVSYSYSFSTPTFGSSFSAINSLLASVGPTIEGTVGFDTDNANPLRNVDSYSIFSQAGELDSLFDTAPPRVYAEKGGTTPSSMFYWQLQALEGRYMFALLFPDSMHGAAARISLDVAGCDRLNNLACTVEDTQALSGFSLLRTDPVEVPEPGTAALVALAGTGLVAMRSRRDRKPVPDPSTTPGDALRV
jgi:hypothetical protein